MRNRLGGVVVALASVLLLACPGAPGADGTNGANGINGVNGTDGTPGAQGLPGDAGPAGASALVRSSVEPAGAHCAHGGTKLEAGVDANGDGVLDPAELSSTSYICDGSGKNSLVATSPEPAGAHCAFGGTRIETGLDANDDGVLAPGEVNAAATSYVCNVAPHGAISPSTGIHVAYAANGVSTSTTAPVSVRFTLKDDRGFPLDLQGRYSTNTPLQPRFALAYFTQANGLVSPLIVSTKTTSTAAPGGQPTSYNPLGAAPGFGTLVENGFGAGDYTYTFPSTSTPNGPLAVAYDATKLNETHVVWIQVSRQTDAVFTDNANTFSADDAPFYFIPSGVGTPLTRELVAQSGCDGCHAKFKPETVSSAVFHGGGRTAAGMCNVCHNPGRTSNPDANSSAFIHRIHNGPNVATANLFHGIAATYPRDIRACDVCHGGAAQGDQASSNPTTLACKGCHDYVSFTASAATFCGISGALARDPDGKPLPCNHVGGPSADNTCATCHGPSGAFPTTRYHAPVAPPDPTNSWLVGGTNLDTNASWVAAGGFVPVGAHVITYDLRSVDLVLDTSVIPNVKRPQLTFKLKDNGADVVFQTYQAGVATELMPHFVGSPGVYFAFAVPQDNVSAPSDFNASVSGNLRNIWNGTATGAGAGILTGPNAAGDYTVRLTGVQIPPAATMLTGGLGYTESLSSAPPLVQIDVPGYTWTPNVPADGRAQGGLSVPAPNVWKVANGFTGRRAIVETARCNACHGALGITPGFHAGQRNDGASCSFCHNPNRTISGWAGNAKYFIHAIHAGRQRVVPYTWAAAAAGPGYAEVEFPGTLNSCTSCHLPNTYDFTSAANLAAVPSMPLTTVAIGRYDTNPLTNSAWYTVSPYVVADNFTDYGSGFSYNAATNFTAQAALSTLVISPLTAACSACHDSALAVNHMKANGGLFYATRQSVQLSGAQEQCLICHGPGRIAAIGVVHPR